MEGERVRDVKGEEGESWELGSGRARKGKEEGEVIPER
jgi:hypothetical protein